MMRFTDSVAGPLDVWMDEAGAAAGVAMIRIIGAVVVMVDACVNSAGV